MVPVLSALLLTTLLIPSLQHPVPNQKMTKIVQSEPEYASLEEIEGPLGRYKRQDPMDGQEGNEGQEMEAVEGEGEVGPSEDEEDKAALSQDTMETMRRISPLNIASQVSQMFKKNGVSVNQPSKEADNPAVEPDTSDANSVSGDDEDAGQSQGSSYPVAGKDASKIVGQPKNNPEFGYSVVVLAGDPVRFPIKVEGKAVKVKTSSGGSTETQKGEISRNCEAEEKINMMEKNSDKDVRVPKEFSENANFPVYDGDFNFTPDPFHGILDQNYWSEEAKDTPNTVDEETGLKPHSVDARFREDDASVADMKSCGGDSGGKHRNGNGTQIK